MTHSLSSRLLALCAAAAALTLLLPQAAQAHGIAHGGIAAGFLHPLSGLDHLLLLLAVGLAGALISGQLLVWALVGACSGGLVGSLGGALPGQELLAALAISAVALLLLRRSPARQGVAAAAVGTAVALHAMLHGLEAPSEGSAALWWLGAFAASLLLSGGSFLLSRRLPLAWSRGMALLLALLGAVLALRPLGLLAS